ncbi:MAG: hypothetical protein DYG98_19470 [Haliscomenobacteraceae bacterium CHB4]|nr:hypothetical protein [Haliscomenobacteraceae bacterium CHB4]
MFSQDVNLYGIKKRHIRYSSGIRTSWKAKHLKICFEKQKPVLPLRPLSPKEPIEMAVPGNNFLF